MSSSNRRSVWLEGLTWVEAEEALRGYALVMIPT